MVKGVLKKGICGLVVALPLYGFADASNPDLIAGYTTQQLADALPSTVDGLKQRALEVAANYHTFQAEYVETARMRKALVTIYTMPVDKKGNIPVASSEQDLKAVVASAEKEMLRQRIKPEVKELTSTDAEVPKFRCLQTIINEKAVHQICSTLFKGRVLEIQPVTLVNDKAFAPAMQRGEVLVQELGKILTAKLK